LDKQQAHEFVQQKRTAYTAFGAVALLLNLIPFVGTLFNITSSVGAALWASKMEQGSINEGNTEQVQVPVESLT